MTHMYTRQDSSERGIGPSRGPVPQNTQHSDIHTPAGSEAAAADPCLRLRDHQDRHIFSTFGNSLPNAPDTEKKINVMMTVMT